MDILFDILMAQCTWGIPRMFQWHLVSNAWILPCHSAFNVQESQTEKSNARHILIIDFWQTFLSFQMILRSVTAVSAALEIVSILEPVSQITDPRYLN